MSRTFDFPLTGEQSQQIARLLVAYNELPSGAYKGLTLPRIYQMVFEGGVVGNKERADAAALPSDAVTASVQVTIRDMYLEEFDELVRRWNLGSDEVLRIVIVDGLAEVEQAVIMFQKGHKFVPKPGSS